MYLKKVKTSQETGTEKEKLMCVPEKVKTSQENRYREREVDVCTRKVEERVKN